MATASWIRVSVCKVSFTGNGVSVPVCAYGSAQFVDTTDRILMYRDGPRRFQDIGQSILRDSGAVFVIPKVPLTPSTTYAVQFKVNGEEVAWRFSTTTTSSRLSNSAGTVE